MAGRKPTASKIITMVERLVGRFSGSVRLPASSMMINEAEAYTVMT